MEIQYVNVPDGIYTGMQVHADPSMRELLQHVPKHRAPHMILEIRNGMLVEIARTKEPCVTLARHNSSIDKALEAVGMHRIEMPAAPLTVASEVDTLKAELAELKAQLKQQSAVVSRPKHVESDDGIPGWRALLSMDEDAAMALAAKHGADVTEDNLSGRALRQWLNNKRKEQE